MEITGYEVMINTLVGMVIIPFAVHAIKSWLKVDLPALKILLVMILSGATGILLSLIYEGVFPDMKEAFIYGINIGLAAVTGKALHKSVSKP